ncbi:MAG: type II secretion system protein GspG [Planctomycetota bacterium]|nr:type II secretion system protein GspG [Planctomycetota bacterium]
MRKTSQRGFTLLELMVVVTILGLLVAIVGPMIPRYISEARYRTARAQMSNLGQAVEMFQMSKRRFPARLDVLTEIDEYGEPYMHHIPRDPWDQDYEYAVISRRHYEIRCHGADGEPGTDDDLVHPIVLEDR